MRKVIVNFSGGKDSTVATLETLKAYPKNEIILCFQDTGAEYKGTREHVTKIAGMLEIPLTILEPKRNWFEQIRHDKFPFIRTLRKCTKRLKIETYYRWLKQFKKENNIDEIISVFGIRGEESSSRSKLPDWSDNYFMDGKVWRPILNMKRQEVFDRIEAEGLPLHYCYEFSSRCNCWLCIFAHYNEIRSYAEMFPDEWERACLLENEIHHPLIGEYSAINDLMKQGRLL